MAKKAAARKSTATKKRAKRAGGTRATALPKRRGVDFKPLHDAMDATLAALNKQRKSIKRDALIVQLRIMRKFRPCPSSGMFVELE